jgi:hypothetical protein
LEEIRSLFSFSCSLQPAAAEEEKEGKAFSCYQLPTTSM